MWTIDEQVEGVHFRRSLVSWREIGWRELHGCRQRSRCDGCDPLVRAGVVGAPGRCRRRRARGHRAWPEGGEPTGSALRSSEAISREAPRAASRRRCSGDASRAVDTRGGPCGGWALAGGTRGAGCGGAEGARAGEGRRPAIRGSRCRMAKAGGAHRRGTRHGGRCTRGDRRLRRPGARCRTPCEPRAASRSSSTRSALVGDGGLNAVAAALGLAAIHLALEGGEDYALLASSDAPIAGFRRVGDVREGTGLCPTDRRRRARDRASRVRSLRCVSELTGRRQLHAAKDLREAG